MVSFNDFLKKVEQSGMGNTVRYHFNEWMKIAGEGNYFVEYGENELSEGLVLNFSQDLAEMISQRLTGIVTEVMYTRTYNEGHAFLREIHRIASESEIELKLEEINVPLTPTDMLSAAGLIERDDRGRIRAKD